MFKSSVSNIHHKIVDAPYSVSSSVGHVGKDVGCWLLSDRCWLLASGCYLLVAGCWLGAAIGCRLLQTAGCYYYKLITDRWLSLLLAAGCWLVLASGRRQT